jgi:hypothetical protein
LRVTLQELLLACYQFADAHALEAFGAALLLPLVGTVLAWIGKGGQTDEDGKFIASAFVAISLFWAMLLVVGVSLGVGVMQGSVLQANALLLLAPVVCLVFTLLGVKLVFPLSQLGSVKSLGDVAAFALACVAVVWFFSKFRGWGIVFFGSVGQLIVLLVLLGFLLKRLFHRAFGSATDKAA